MTDLSANLRDKIGIIGLGVSGQAVHALLKHAFPEKQILTFDDKSPDADTNDPDKMINFAPETIIVSPGFPLTTKWVNTLRNLGAWCLNEVELASYFFQNEKVVGITGSIGKSTTSALIFEGFKADDNHTFLGANFGTPVCSYILEILTGQRTRAKWLVLELSSYHLETLKHLKLDLGIITYLSSNHLERYQDLRHYYNTKLNIFNLTKGPVLINSHSPDLLQELPQLPKNAMAVGTSYDKDLAQTAAGFSLIGEHNLQNVLLALKTMQNFGLLEKASKNILQFKGLPHRLENLGTHNGILFINDSKATSMDSVVQAVESAKTLAKSGSLYVLLGGKDKGLPWEQLKSLSQIKNAKFIFFGACGENAKSATGLSGPVFKTFAEALTSLQAALKANDVCLLAPGGTSWDEFKSFEERGDFFKKFVRKNFN